MCGITGFVGARNKGACPEETLHRMNDALFHRGPDDGGVWIEGSSGVGLGHRRLSILDLSPAGHQPMASQEGRFIIVFNGEIYNHLDIRSELETAGTAPAWRGHADTETLLAAFEAWGIDATLTRCVGMFGLAVWDKSARTLTLARDRMGEKPLYYGWNNGAFIFASELKAFRACPSFDAAINRNAITLLLRHNYIPAPHSVYRGVFKLQPGAMLTLSQGGGDACPWNIDDPPFDAFQGGGISLRPYWSLHEVVRKGQTEQFSGSGSDAVAVLEHLLLEAVQSQQISDVPLGAFLSGGVDSSTIVALMQSRSSLPVKTFTIGFNETGYNEAEYAKAVAKHLGTDHTELYVTSSEALSVIPKLPLLYDEPFSDSSQIPTFLVSQLAKQHVTVSLSGDAGDELFGGYSRYFLAQSIKSKMDRMPSALRQGVAGGIRLLSAQRWNHLTKPLAPLFGVRRRGAYLGDKAYRVAEMLTEDPENMYRGLVSHWKEPASVVIGATEPQTALTRRFQWDVMPEFMQRLMFVDAVSYLPDDILVKVDRAAMGVSLESRVPFLDHRVVEFAARLPLAIKTRNGEGKWPLRQVLYKYVPREMIERPKMGFGVPIDSWLRGPLREWSEELLDERRLKQEGFFNPSPIRQKLKEHISGERNNQYYLWDILMFQAWLESTR